MSLPTRIVALADSLAMPRDEDGDVLLWEETWPYLLERRLRERSLDVEVINRAARARSSDRLLGLEFVENVRWLHPQVLLIQVGIVDCAPRVFSRLEKRLLNLPVVPGRLRDRVVRHRSQRRKEITARDPLGKVHTEPRAYERDLETLLARARDEEPGVRLVVLLPILSQLAFMEAKSPGHSANVRLYNEILRRTAQLARAPRTLFVEPESMIADALQAEAFMSDGYHLSKIGSAAVADRLADVVGPAIDPAASGI